MKMLRRLKCESLQIVLLALPFVLAAAWWNKIPPTVVTHWGVDGHPNGWMPKAPGILLLPLTNVALCALLTFLPRVDPRLRREPSTDTARLRRVLKICRYALGIFLSEIAVAIIATAAGWNVNITGVIYFGSLAVFLVLGNVFGNLEPNYLIGVRTPWTLEDPGTWRATHRLTGRIMVFGAGLLLVSGFFLSSLVNLTVLFAFIMGVAVWSLSYSAWYFQRRRAA